MRKIFRVAVLTAVLALCASSATAQFTLGAKGIFALGAGTSLEGDAARSADGLGRYPTVGGGAGIFFRADFIRAFGGLLGVQGEVSFSGPYGLSVRSRDSSVEYALAAVDFPVSLTYSVPLAGIIRLVPSLGVNFSVPVGRLSGRWREGDDSYIADVDVSHFNFGMSFGVAGEMRLGPGFVTAELRYLMDFTRLRAQQVVAWDDSFEPVYGMVDFMTRRAAQLSLGYQIPLSF